MLSKSRYSFLNKRIRISIVLMSQYKVSLDLPTSGVLVGLHHRYLHVTFVENVRNMCSLGHPKQNVRRKRDSEVIQNCQKSI